MGKSNVSGNPAPGLPILLDRMFLAVRWLQLPMLIGLVGALLVLELKFAMNLWEAFVSFREFSRIKVVLLILDLIDTVLIANLITMVIVVGFRIFITPAREDDATLRQSMGGSSPGDLKVRIATTVLLIATIHRLHMFFDPTEVTRDEAIFALVTHVLFILTALSIVLIERVRRGPV
ncbi:YqhA family protein [Aliiruegeria lutimaris]|uniref:TIGR00645 family protein n=1 Tax=Aliiruegeria lutimaris TaxID=571298 RepID=A0A1G9IB70_9RHOB|nr:YqhA family protein [Aliiruegeria lutimaris]SDL22508.1 TIGR00645 family protein [Aliiruegeria lutimaris]